jgi:hypothetical protein
MTIFWTIFAGVCVYVLGQLALKFVIDPVHQQRETIGKIVDFLIYHADRYTNPGGFRALDDLLQAQRENRVALLNETKRAARMLASDLMVRTLAIPFYGLLERFGWAPTRANIREAQSGLFFLSNALYEGGDGIENYEKAQSIEKALGVSTEFHVDEPTTEEAQPGG